MPSRATRRWRELADAGFLVSFALPLAFRSAAGPRAAAVELPDDCLLVETDAPWLAPGGAGWGASSRTRHEPSEAPP